MGALTTEHNVPHACAIQHAEATATRNRSAGSGPRSARNPLELHQLRLFEGNMVVAADHAVDVKEDERRPLRSCVAGFGVGWRAHRRRHATQRSPGRGRAPGGANKRRKDRFGV